MFWWAPVARERVRQRRSAEPARNWSAEIDQRIGAEHAFMIEVIGQAMGEVREQIEDNVRNEFEEQLRSLRVEVCDTKIRHAELRISHAELREQLTASHVTEPMTLRSRAN